jgi:alpha-methylacyl-CoA racemase
MSPKPLAGIKVLDLSRQFPGPYATMVLADFGAEVLRVEDRRFIGDPSAGAVMRNKRHLSLNLKTEAGKEIFFKLLADTDVLVEGFRPGVTGRLGVGYADLKPKKPDLIYCSLSGYGQTGPYRSLAGHDLNYQGFAGIIELSGEPGQRPVIPPVQIADVGGGLNAVVGILLALFHRSRTGQGQYIDVSLMDAALGFQQLNFNQFLDLGLAPERGRQPLTGLFPSYHIYETKDGKFITLAAIEARFWTAFCQAVGREDLKQDQYAMGERREQIIAELTLLFKQKTRDEWFEQLKEIDVCIGKALTLPEVMTDPQVQAREMVVTVEDHGKKRPLLGVVPKLSATPGDVRTPPAVFGEHTREVLKELGYTNAQIAEFEKAGVI